MIHKKFFLVLSVVCITLFARESTTNKPGPELRAKRTQYSRNIRKSIEILKRINCSQEHFFETGKPGCDCTFTSNYNFQHKATKQCVAMMEQSGNFVPLIQLADKFATFSYLHSNTFSREFLLLVFIAYRNLIVNNASKKNMQLKKTVMETITRVYEKIDTIPHEQIIEAIIFLARELPPFLEKHEFYSDMSWKVWLTKYWWIPPTVFTATGVTFCTGIPIPLFCKKKKTTDDDDEQLNEVGIH